MWRVPVYIPYINPPVNDTMIREVESELKVKLPAAYLALLKIQNGGYLSPSVPRHGSGDWIGGENVNPIAGIGPKFPNLLDEKKLWAWVKEEAKEANVDLHLNFEKVVPFAGDGHWFYCFDYRKNGPLSEPVISFLDVETFGHDCVVAKSFDELLSMLVYDDSFYTLGIRSSLCLEEVMELLSKLLNVNFQKQDLKTFPTYGAKYTLKNLDLTAEQIDSSKSWLELYPNKVKRAYEVEGATLDSGWKYLLEEEAYQKPQFSEYDYLLDCENHDAFFAIADLLKANGVDCKVLEIEKFDDGFG